MNPCGQRTKKTRIASKQSDFLRETNRRHWRSVSSVACWSGSLGLEGNHKKRTEKKLRNRSESRSSLFLKWPSHKTWIETWEISADEAGQKMGEGREVRGLFSFSSHAQKPLYYLAQAPVRTVETSRQDGGFMLVLPRITTRPNMTRHFHLKQTGHVTPRVTSAHV